MRSERLRHLPKAIQQWAQTDPNLGSGFLSSACFTYNSLLRETGFFFFFFLNHGLRLTNEQRSQHLKSNKNKIMLKLFKGLACD